MNVYAVILCGGSGTRLWPLSRKKKPKQFLSLGSDSLSLLQNTVERVKSFIPKERRWLVTVEDQADLVKEQVGEDIGRVILEPAPRNTSLAVALAAYELKKHDPDAIMVILPSDHFIENVRSFEKTLEEAISFAKKDFYAVIGITPTFPATGFGYIECYEPLFQGDTRIGYTVRSFREKPHQAAAEQFLKTGKYLWNAGMFVWKVQSFWEAFSEFQPETIELLEKSRESDFKKNYSLAPALPIDITFVEKARNLVCIEAHFDWNDMGNWSAVWEGFSSTLQENAVRGETYIENTSGCLIHSTGPFIATLGIKDLAIIATPDALLVADMKAVQDVKKVIEYLNLHGKTDLL